MRNIKVVLEYEGTAYAGFQVQANANTIQAQIESALNALTGEEIRIVGSGRTDSGVHAKGQVINFHTCSRIPADRFAAALNTRLPRDIRALESSEESPQFNARFSVKSKTYCYRILNRPAPSALLRNLAYWVPDILDIEAMNRCAQQLVGAHDFRAFRSTGSDVESTVRTVTACTVEADSEQQTVDIRVCADGFLYNMVRIIAGTLIEIGKGRLPEDTILKMLESGERNLGGPTAPARGLYLEHVVY
ncbi:MAG: tRNA pseudouridine(38-40) synthase TruA [Firmicutes bacterium]|jgi:tRNA pseudouridine38-40 synthase|nr:tRNA pseudouridine(38-40) synthase TruA [Bacillota bacterium]